MRYLLLAALALAGCGPTIPTVDPAAELAKAKAGNAVLTQAVTAEHHAAVTAQQQVDADKGKLAADEAALASANAAEAQAKHEAEIAPLRATLRWAEGISLLGLLACVALTVAAYFWSMGFAAKIPMGIGAAFGGVFLTSLGASWSLDHLVWILVALGLCVAAGVAWALHHHLTLIGAARKAWDATPDTVDLGPKAEALYARLIPKPKG